MSAPPDLPHEDLGATWRAGRPRPAGRHLDSAACSRQSSRALDAAAHHARHEAELGGYVAEAASDRLLQQGRSVLAGLVGMAAADVAFVESAQAALAALLTGWRLPAGSRVACLPGEYAPNVAQLRAYGLRPEPLPVDGIGRLASGTPPVLALAALDAALDVFEGVDHDSLRAASLSLTDYFIELVDARRGGSLEVITPRSHDRRGSQVSLRHEHAYGIVQALIARGVIGDFRTPDVARFGFAPLYVTHADVYDAVDHLVAVMEQEEYARAEYSTRNAVT